MIYTMKQEGLYEDKINSSSLLFETVNFGSVFAYLFQGLHKAGGKYGYKHSAQRFWNRFGGQALFMIGQWLFWIPLTNHN